MQKKGSLTFITGTMYSGKTTKLIHDANKSKKNNKKVLIIKIAIDDRFKKNEIRSLNDTHIYCDFCIDNQSDILSIINYNDIDEIYVDEAQFLEPCLINKFEKICKKYDIDVYLYGLTMSFKGKIFDNSKKIIEICDKLIELKTKCGICNSKNAIFNLRYDNSGNVLLEGDMVKIDNKKSGVNYIQLCDICWDKCLISQKLPALY